ncbi:MAG: hypothetical protein QM639_20315, partial [Rhodocyclaceae bacterium]
MFFSSGQRAALVLACALASGAAHAMTYALDGATLTVSGPVDEADRDTLRRHFQSGVTTLVLKGVGGRLDLIKTYEQVGKVVAQSRVTTVADGACTGACAMLFV